MCQNYVRCASGIKTQEGVCPSGQYFDSATQGCGETIPNDCQHPTCISFPRVNYQFAIRTDSCSSSYYQCDNNNYVTLNNCPATQVGSYYNHVTRQCAAGSAPASCATERPDYVCIGKTPGNYQDSKAIQCATYYACANNVGTKQTCPSNAKFFNRVTRACQADAPDGQNCVSTATNCANEKDFMRLPHATDCTKYIECQGGSDVEKSCPSAKLFPNDTPNGLFFSPYFKTCINTTTGNCPTHVPTGPENVCTEISDFINFGLSMTKLPDPNDCRRYYTCENQKLKGDSDCVSVTYDMDNHYCNFNAKCLFPDPRA